jgi:hypothetical protein
MKKRLIIIANWIVSKALFPLLTDRVTILYYPFKRDRSHSKALSQLPVFAAAS